MTFGRLLIALLVLGGSAGGGYAAWQWHEQNQALAPLNALKALGTSHLVGEYSAKGPGRGLVTLNGGFTLRITYIDELPPSDGENGTGTDPGDTIIRVHAVLHSIGPTAPLRTGGMLDAGTMIQVWYGPNRQQANDEGGSNTATDIFSVLPERITGGTSVKFYSSFDVPPSQLGNLTVGLDPFADPNFPGVTITDAQVLLRK